MEKSNQTNIVLGADDAYAMPLAVTICSILKNVNPEAFLHFFLLDGGIKDKSKKRVRNVFIKHGDQEKHTYDWLTPDFSSVEALPTKGKSHAIYLPLLIPNLLPPTSKKAIFLDCDLILETNIQQLWEQDTDGTVISAVRDILIQTLSDPKGVKTYRELGGHADSPYFNSGVMLINLDLWRQEKVTEKAIDYLFKNRKTMYHRDQEALNAVFIDRWKELDPGWNQQGSIYWPQVLPESEFTTSIMKSYHELTQNPFIIHFLSPSKPWSYKCMHPEARKFLFYLKESGWFTRPEWMLWWSRLYLKRFFWLLRDLRQTMKMIQPKETETDSNYS